MKQTSKMKSRKTTLLKQRAAWAQILSHILWLPYVSASLSVLNHISLNALISTFLIPCLAYQGYLSSTALSAFFFLHFFLLCYCRYAAHFTFCQWLCNEACRQGLCRHRGPNSPLWVSAKKENLGLGGGGRRCKCLLSESWKLYTRLNDHAGLNQSIKTEEMDPTVAGKRERLRHSAGLKGS